MSSVRLVPALLGALASLMLMSGAFGVPAAARTDGIALGVFIEGAPADAAPIESFEAATGATPAIIAWYQAWGGAYAAFDPTLLERVVDRGATPLITWEPWVPGAGIAQPDFALDRIASGAFDAYIDDWAKGLANYDERVLLRFGHEMNGDWYPWAASVNGNSAAGYVAAWRRIHDRFAAAGADNVRWIWSPNIAYEGSTAYAALYPGDAYVDWLALDGYNFGAVHDWSVWTSFSELFGSSYSTLRSIAEKPVMVAEVASTEAGGDKAAWIRAMFMDELPASFPAVRAVVWFNHNKETDWALDSSDTALAAFSEAVAQPFYRAALGDG